MRTSLLEYTRASSVADGVGERLQDEFHVFGGGTVAHGADAEDLAGQRSEAAGDLHAVFLQQKLTDLGIVHARGNARRVERPKTVAGGNEHRQAHGLDAGDERLVVPAVAVPTRFQTFLGDHGEAFAQSVKRAGRRRVVILVASVEAVQKQQVQIERLHRRLPRLEAFQGARRHRDRRQAGRAAEPLLGAAVGDVDTDFVYQHGHAAQRGDAIGNGERVHFVGRFANRLPLVVESGGRLGLHESEHARAFAADELASFLRVARLAPGLGEADDFAAVAPRHFANAVAEETVGEQGELFAGLYN